MVSQERQGGILKRPDCECLASVVKRSGFIAPIQRENLHGKIRREAFRTQLHGTGDPILGLIGVV